ncbi:MAG: HAMP domain-containing histidine kinase [Bdellovibrionales bacterium]|nr:HAMP domain-containing histidine kinase [Bdellovibrionales bacterium]
MKSLSGSAPLLSILRAGTLRGMLLGTALALVVSSVIAWVNLRASAEREMSIQVKALADSFRNLILGGEIRHSEFKMRTALDLKPTDIVKVLDENGHIIYSEPGVPETWALEMKWSGPFHLNAVAPIYFDREQTILRGYIAISRQVSIEWNLFLMVFGSLMIGQLIFVWVYRTSVMRVGLHLSGQLTALRRGLEMSAPAGETSIAELEAIRAAFARVQEEISDLERVGAQSKSLKSVAHDIRSPLSALSIGIKSLKHIPHPVRELLDEAYLRVESIAADILKNESASLMAEVSVCDMANRIEDLIAEKTLEHNERGLHWGIQADPAVWNSSAMIGVSSVGLIRTLSNLLNNSAEAAPAGSTVRLNMVLSEEAVIFRVVDEGPGIQVQAMAAFLKGGVSGKTGGFGMGLSGARRFAEAHGGSLRLHNLDMGFEVELSIPLMASHKTSTSKLL